jgi:hypothetical protein
MIPTEIITFALTTAIGAWIKLKSKQMEAQKHNADLWAQHAGVTMDDRIRAREFVPPAGPWVRRLIVVSVLFAVFIAPFILATFFPDTPVFYAYSEKSRGFLFLIESLERMEFQQMTGYVILPVHTQMAAAISGFYFGGGLAK